MKRARRQITATLATLVLVISSVACDPPKREQLVKVAGYGQQLSALLEANWTLPDSLFQAGVITGDRRDEVKNIFAASRTAVDAFNAGMKEALAVEKPDYAALVPLVADIIAQVQRLNIGVKSEVYRKTLAAIEISLRGVASFFALQIRQARAAGYDDNKLARVADIRAVRAVEAFAARG